MVLQGRAAEAEKLAALAALDAAAAKLEAQRGGEMA